MIARHPGKMLAVALSSDGELCATSATDERATDVRVWNVDSGELRLPPLPHNNTVSVLAFSPDGEILAAGDYDGVVLLWDISTGALIGKPLEQRDIVTCLSFSRDGTRLVVGTASDWNHDPQARLWNVSTQKPIGEPMRHGNYVRRVVLVPMETEC
jgi:WD40 repeat protein